MQTGWLREGGSEYYSHFHKWKLMYDVMLRELPWATTESMDHQWRALVFLPGAQPMSSCLQLSVNAQKMEKARMEAQRKSPDGRHKIAHVSQSLLSSSHVLVVTKQNRTHCLYVAAFLWSTSRVATQPFPARLEIFAITWLPVRQLNLTVWGGAAVAPPPASSSDGSWAVPLTRPCSTALTHQGSSTSLDICLQPQPNPASNSPCNCVSCSKPPILKRHQQSIHSVKQCWPIAGELATISSTSPGAAVFWLICFLWFNKIFPFVALFPDSRANIPLCSPSFSSQCPTARRGSRMSPTCSFHEGSPVLQQGCLHTYPSVPRNGELAQAHQEMAVSKWSCSCGLLGNVLGVSLYRYLSFALHLVANGNFKAKAFMLSSINTLLKLPWRWKGHNFIFLPNIHPSSGPVQPGKLLLGSCQLEGDLSGLQWHSSPCGFPDFCCCPKPSERKQLLYSPF